ncbi:hypothetical protein KIN20_030720, partial [Parelaphostrongylus tenuis]
FQFPPTVAAAEKKCDLNGPDANTRIALSTTLCHIDLDQFAMTMFVVCTDSFSRNEASWRKKAILTERVPEIVVCFWGIGVISTIMPTGMLHSIMAAANPINPLQNPVTVLPTIMHFCSFIFTKKLLNFEEHFPSSQ